MSHVSQTCWVGHLFVHLRGAWWRLKVCCTRSILCWHHWTVFLGRMFLSVTSQAWSNAHAAVLMPQNLYLCLPMLHSGIIVTRCRFDNLSFLMGLLIFLIYRGKRFRAFTTPRTKWRASKRWLFFPPLVFSICALSLCKSLHAARHLDCTLGQRYEHNFKRQSRDGGAPWWFHHWQDRLQASGSKPHFDLGRFISSEPLLSGGVGESKAWQQLGSCLSKMFKIRLQRIELEGRVLLRPNKRTHDDGEHLEYE